MHGSNPLSVQLTLHPTLPFIRLVAVQKTKVIVGPPYIDAAERQSCDTQEGKGKWIKVLVLF